MKTALFFPLALLVSASLAFAIDITDLESRATKGEAEAEFLLARAYLHGDGVSKNIARAWELMSSAAIQGHAEALGGVGFFYANGIVVTKNMEKALEWFRKGADQGGAKAQLNLGNLLTSGNAGVVNEAEGKKWIKAAADQNLPEALWTEGCIYYFGKYGEAVNYALAFPLIQNAAKQGHSASQNLLGVMFEFGQGTNPDEKEAQVWYRAAAEKGEVKAQMNLGKILGPESSDPACQMESLAWLFLASENGEVAAEKLIPDHSPEEMSQAKKLAADLKKSLSTSTPSK